VEIISVMTQAGRLPEFTIPEYDSAVAEDVFAMQILAEIQSGEEV